MASAFVDRVQQLEKKLVNAQEELEKEKERNSKLETEVEISYKQLELAQRRQADSDRKEACFALYREQKHPKVSYLFL